MKFEQTKEVLNQLVADLSQMAMVVHQTHWYMR
ncbi:MAG: DNA starvation/stationary phase protection protein, partial [Enterococcus gallinarum]|nr:DNA starvation/stationary phase protection protein [Enterococcus gallinarum]MBS5962072.1 DNA starvation/stationary phase protection protein [Enterococcus gallinarum]